MPGALFYLQVARDQLQQQEVSASHSQKEQPRLAGGSKTHVERRVNRCLRGPQVDVAISIEGNFSNRQRNTAMCVNKQQQRQEKRPLLICND